MFAALLWIAYSGRGGAAYAFLNHVPGGDKTGYVALMGVLAFTLSWMSSFRAVRMGNVPAHLGALVVFVFITIEEFAQTLSPHRTFDLADLACDYLGVALASWVCFAVTRAGRKSCPVQARPNVT